jgi:hypothetical protein
LVGDIISQILNRGNPNAGEIKKVTADNREADLKVPLTQPSYQIWQPV